MKKMQKVLKFSNFFTIQSIFYLRISIPEADNHRPGDLLIADPIKKETLCYKKMVTIL